MKTNKFQKKMNEIKDLLEDYKISEKNIPFGFYYKIGIYEIHIYDDLMWFFIPEDNFINEIQDCSQWKKGVIGSRYRTSHNENGGHDTFQMNPKFLLDGLIDYIKTYIELKETKNEDLVYIRSAHRPQ
jgi:hypothetical protein